MKVQVKNTKLMAVACWKFVKSEAVAHFFALKFKIYKAKKNVKIMKAFSEGVLQSFHDILEDKF
jgi:hypothetical protein